MRWQCGRSKRKGREREREREREVRWREMKETDEENHWSWNWMPLFSSLLNMRRLVENYDDLWFVMMIDSSHASSSSSSSSLSYSPCPNLTGYDCLYRGCSEKKATGSITAWHAGGLCRDMWLLLSGIICSTQFERKREDAFHVLEGIKFRSVDRKIQATQLGGQPKSNLIIRATIQWVMQGS